MSFDLEDDWENLDLSDLLVVNEKRELDLKRIEERKIVEEEDNVLTEELFSVMKSSSNNTFRTNKIMIYPEKKQKLALIHEDRKEKLREKQKQVSKQLREIKERKKRSEELYGEATRDHYYEQYGNISDKY